MRVQAFQLTEEPASSSRTPTMHAGIGELATSLGVLSLAPPSRGMSVLRNVELNAAHTLRD